MIRVLIKLIREAFFILLLYHRQICSIWKHANIYIWVYRFCVEIHFL